MYEVSYNFAPANISNLFTRVKDIHNYHTRSLQVTIITLSIHVLTPRQSPFHVLAYVYGTRCLLILGIYHKKLSKTLCLNIYTSMATILKSPNFFIIDMG